MIDEDGKRKAKPQPPEIPPHISEDFTPAQKKAFGMTGKHAAETHAPKRAARKAGKRAAKEASTEAPVWPAEKE